MAEQFSMKDIFNSIQVSEGFHELTDEELDSLQKTLLEIYEDVFNVCREHDLKLFLQGGTLLGKVRHNGFIPWDDDLDLGMFRTDYEKLIEIFDNTLSDKYELRAPGYHKGASSRFIHIYKKDSYLEQMDFRPDTPKKIYIDIFPIDYAPNNAAARYCKAFVCDALMFIASSKDFKSYCTSEMKKRITSSKKGFVNYYARSITASVFSGISIQKLYVWINKAAAGEKKTDFCTSALGRYHYLGELQKSTVFFPLIKSDFCGSDAWTINDEKSYLKHNYGANYMDVPGEEKRERHFIKQIKF